MIRYIDAEKLKDEIHKHIGKYDSMLHDWAVQEIKGKKEEAFALLTFVESLQQERPEGLHFTPLNRLIQKIPSGNWNDTTNNYAKKLRDCLIKEGYLKDADVLQGYISYMNGNNVPMVTMDEQEQPEVDLDKEIELVKGDYEQVGVEWNKDFDCIARHFFELGRLNAGKEE